MTHVGAVVLAAGESTRMGQLKALLPWQGKPLLRYQVCSLLDAGIEDIVVVLGHRARDLEVCVKDTPARTVVNPRYAEGKTTSIKLGVGRLSPDTEALLVLAVDQPRPPELTRRLLEAHCESGAPITVPTYMGRRGHPPVFSSALVPELLAIDEGTRGLYAVVERHRDETNYVAFDTPLVRLDLNTPDAYEYARQLGLS